MTESIKQRTGALANNSDAVQLKLLLDAVRTELVALRALSNELRTDHATLKTSYDAIETLIEELHDDHATTKTAVDETKTLIDELHDDHATSKTAVDVIETLIEELHDDHATTKTAVDEAKTLIDELHDDHATQKTATDEAKTLIDELHDDHATNKTTIDESRTAIMELIDDADALVTWQGEVDGDMDEINDYLHYLNERDGVIGGNFSLSAGTATTLTGAGRIRYRINGIEYEVALNTTIALEDNGNIAQNKFGAWRLLIDAAGVVTAQDTAGAGAMDHGSAIDALLSLSQRARTANTIEFGYLTLTDSDSVINLGTDNLDATGVTAVIYTLRQPRLASGLDAALGSSVVDDVAASTWSCGTVDRHRLGVSAAQIAAITNQVMDDADTITTLKFGGWLLVTDPVAGTAVYALGADGIAGVVTAMAYNDAATRNAALDTLEARLPATCVVVGRILVENGSAGTFTAGATNWDAADMTTTVEDGAFTTHSRADTVGAQHGVDAPVIPDTVAAALNVALFAGDPTAGAATLDASKPTAGPATLDASKPTAGPGTLGTSKPASGPATLDASKPTAGPGTLGTSKPASGPDALTASTEIPETLAE